MTLMGWIKIRILGAVDPSRDAALIESIEQEKSKLHMAENELSREVNVIQTYGKRKTAIFEVLDDALSMLDKKRQQ